MKPHAPTRPLLLALVLTPVALLAVTGPSSGHAQPATTAGSGEVSLSESLRPTPVRDLAAGRVPITGSAKAAEGAGVRVRVTTSFGATYETRVAAMGGQFRCRFPQDFPGAPKLKPALLYVDATTAAEFDADPAQAEALLIVAGRKPSRWPDLPLVFMDDFLDARGRRDTAAAQWSRNRALANHFMHSRAAHRMRIRHPGFDLAQPESLAWFRERATLYDFDHRDRDWSRPLGNRVARGFWQAVWNRWFNPTNNHPWDGNPANRDPSNYRPYTFTNDAADLLVLYQMLRKVPPAVADNRDRLTEEVLANLLAMQHRSPENFALREKSGRQEHYSAGAFRYGMFETGEWLTEGKGWFANPAFRDFVEGGVFNGRAAWALGESLRANPSGPLAEEIRRALALTLRFCLRDGEQHGYTWRTRSGLPVWSRIGGEHGYLVQGMLAAAEVSPELRVPLGDGGGDRTLREACLRSLDALAEIVREDGTWTVYPNADAVNITALSEGARLFPRHPRAGEWKRVAARAADVWLNLKFRPAERKTPHPLFGQRHPDGMSFYLGSEPYPFVTLYTGGHWLHALAALHSVTGTPRYRERAEAILAYYCGDNPLRVRLLNELGSVNNRVTDRDKDGVEDQLNWDAYPESTAFVQIGLLHLLGG